MIDQINNQLHASAFKRFGNDTLIAEKGRSNDSASQRQFDKFIMALNVTLQDSLTAISINNSTSTSRSNVAPSISSNIGSFANSVSSDGKLSNPSIKQAPSEQTPDELIIHIGSTNTETIMLGKKSSTDL